MEQLQTDSELPVTGFVDEATARALQDKLTAAGLDQARQTVMLQTILSLVGFWDGPIDGVWTDELTQALKDFQTHLGVEPTGVVDAADDRRLPAGARQPRGGDADDHCAAAADGDDSAADRDHRRSYGGGDRCSSPTPDSARSSPPPTA